MATDTTAKPALPEPDQTASYRGTEGQDQLLHLFLPQGTNRPLPIVVLIHGGGWVQGSPRQFFWHARQLADAGVAACSISYRVAHQARYPAALADCRAAIGWLRDNAGRLRIDPDRIGVVGSSAGGYLAVSLAVGGEPVAGLQAIVDIHGVHDLPPLAGLPAGRRCEQFLGVPFDEAPDLWREASLVQRVTGRTPPMLLLHDPDDPVVPYVQTRRLFKALLAARCSAQLIPTPGSGHGYIYDRSRYWTRRAWPMIQQWLLRCLRE